jgi:hypothetical protein
VLPIAIRQCDQTFCEKIAQFCQKNRPILSKNRPILSKKIAQKEALVNTNFYQKEITGKNLEILIHKVAII